MVASVITTPIAAPSRQLCARLSTIFVYPPVERAIPKATAIGRSRRLVKETEHRPIVELRPICTQACPRHRLPPWRRHVPCSRHRHRRSSGPTSQRVSFWVLSRVCRCRRSTSPRRHSGWWRCWRMAFVVAMLANAMSQSVLTLRDHVSGLSACGRGGPSQRARLPSISSRWARAQSPSS